LPVSGADVIEMAFRHAKEQLFKPFRFAQWARLAFVGLLAGEMSSGGGCNFSVPINNHSRGTGTRTFLDPTWPSQLTNPFTNHPALTIGLITSAIVILFVLTVLFTYISSVMRFILFDSIVTRECRVRSGWVRRKRPGLRLFWWQILFGLACMAGFLVVFGIPLACTAALHWFAHPREHLVGLILGGLVLFVLLFIFILFIGVVRVMTKDFVVPQMACEDISAMEGWRRLWLWLKHDKGGYAGYIGMKIVLGLGASIAMVIVSVIVLLVLLVPIGGAAFAAVLVAKAAGWTWTVYTITLAVILGTIALTILVSAGALVSVPVVVFFVAYSIYFFAPRYAQLASLMWPPPPAPVALP
jgi:hypothetical protein